MYRYLFENAMTEARTPIPNSLVRSVSAVVLEQSANARPLEGLSSSSLVAATAGAQVKIYIYYIDSICLSAHPKSQELNIPYLTNLPAGYNTYSIIEIRDITQSVVV